MPQVFDCRIIRRLYNKKKEWLVFELYDEGKIVNSIIAFTHPDITKYVTIKNVKKQIVIPAVLWIPEKMTKGQVSVDKNGQANFVGKDKGGFKTTWFGINRFHERVSCIYKNQYK